MPWCLALNVSLSRMEPFFKISRIRSDYLNLTYSIQGSSGESYTLYTAKAIQETKPLCLTHGGMVLIALMSGGDYSKGMPGCSFSISSALARCGFGDSLLHAFNSMAPKDLETYMEQWCKDLRDELRSNSMGNLRSKQVHLADQIPLNFINRDILELYLKPCTSSTDPDSMYSPADWRSREPSIGKIANFCSQKFGWKTTEALARNMRNNLWEGVFFRMLASVCVGFPSSVSTLIFLQFAILYDPNQHRFGTPSTLATAAKIEFKKRASQSGTWAHIQLIPDNFIALLGVRPNSGFTHESKTTDARAERISIWVPKQYLPPMVVSYLPGELASMPRSLPEHTMQPSESPLPLTDPSVKDFQINSSSGTFYPQVNHRPGIQDLRKSSKRTCPTSMPHHQEVGQSSAAVKPLNASQSRVLRALDIIDLTGPDPDCDPDLCATGSTHLKRKHGMAFQNQDEVIEISD